MHSSTGTHSITFYIVTERCYCPLNHLFASVPQFQGALWVLPIARCLLQAVHYLHLHEYAHQDIHLGNVFAAFARNEMNPAEPGSIQFKLGDLGVTKLFSELDAANTLAEWIRPPEAIDPSTFGPLGSRLDIYHLGLLSSSSPPHANSDLLVKRFSLGGLGNWRRNFRHRITSRLKKRSGGTLCSAQKPRWNCGEISMRVRVSRLQLQQKMPRTSHDVFCHARRPHLSSGN
jgi:serine/threonine protein kinase